MMDEHFTLINLFLSGHVSGYEQVPKPTHIKTVISHIFVFDEVAFKLYRRDNVNFNTNFCDLNSAERTEFIERDFLWNNYFNSEVYQKIVRCTPESNKVVFGKAGEQIIQMKTFNTDTVLTNALRQQLITKTLLKNLGYSMTKKIAEFPYTPETTDTYFESYSQRIADLEEWLLLANRADVSLETISDVTAKLHDYLSKEKKKFGGDLNRNLVIAPDIHTDNILFYDNRFYFIDMCPVKKNRLLAEPFMNICKTAACVYVLSGSSHANALIDGYKKYYGLTKVDTKLQNFYLAYWMIFHGGYIYLLAKENAALRQEAKSYFTTANTLLHSL